VGCGRQVTLSPWRPLTALGGVDRISGTAAQCASSPLRFGIPNRLHPIASQVVRKAHRNTGQSSAFPIHLDKRSNHNEKTHYPAVGAILLGGAALAQGSTQIMTPRAGPKRDGKRLLQAKRL
jgi:hypothetical protein